jgi:hypothetical protein
VKNASNYLTFDSVQPPVDIATPRIWSVSSPVTKKATSTVSIEIHKGAIFDCLKINHFDVIYILILFVLLAKLSYLYVNIRMRNMFHFVQTFNARSNEHRKTLETNLPILINQGLNGCNLVCHLDSEPKC